MRDPFDIVADLDTPVSAFLKLATFQPRFLLESVEGGERLGRYSFIGLGSGLELRVEDGVLAIDGVESAAPQGRDAWLAVLRQALTRAPRLLPEVTGVPYTGGLVGATGFGLQHTFEDLSIEEGAEPPLARYVAPRSIFVFDHMSRRAALLHAGSEEERETLRQEIIATLRGPTPAAPGPAMVEDPRASFSQPLFEDTVRRVQEHIREGDVYQLVLSNRFEGRTDVHPFQVYRALRLLNPSPYMYYCDFADLQIVGSSPEALVRLEGRSAFLMPIAGTRPRGRDAAEDQALSEELLADPKEGAEHVMLVDLARNDLGRVATAGSVRVEPFRTIERYSHVIHMVSGVRGDLRPEVDAFELFASSFPAGTVVGAPKIRAAEIIRELEPVPRRYYAGSVGYFGASGSMDQAIAIRTITFSGGRYAFQAGAGIVADSVPAKEYEEVLAKSAVLRAALAMAGEGL